MSCFETIQSYAFRSLGYGEKLLPRSDFDLCQQFTLIGSGMIWNVYFAILALFIGFFVAAALALGKASDNKILRATSSGIIFIFRGSPLFIQMFFGYFLFLSLKKIVPELGFFTNAWAGALFTLMCNTAAYTGEIFYGALKAIPKGEIEAANAYGMTGWSRFRRITWPTMLRLAWPAYTNEAIFLFHATTLVFFTGFPARGQRGDALYYANYFADKTFNPFIPYPILAFYFILFVLLIVFSFGLMNKRLNRHLPSNTPRAKRPRFSLLR